MKRDEKRRHRVERPGEGVKVAPSLRFRTTSNSPHDALEVAGFGAGYHSGFAGQFAGGQPLHSQDRHGVRTQLGREWRRQRGLLGWISDSKFRINSPLQGFHFGAVIPSPVGQKWQRGIDETRIANGRSLNSRAEIRPQVRSGGGEAFTLLAFRRAVSCSS
ncbi:MAG: hypothetical protein JWM16_6139 [Verrucomicrobiales bacterium]|nr:hypothetical protein [Verrucomicrobiales bacterium]